MGEGFGLASLSEPPFVVQREGRIVGGCDPQTQPGSAAFAGPSDHSVHESAADTMPTRFRDDEHPDEHGPGISRIVRVAGKTSCDPEPLAVPLRHESYTISPGGPTLCTLAPYIVTEILLPCQRRAKRHGCITEGAQSKGSQFQSFICSNPANLQHREGSLSEK